MFSSLLIVLVCTASAVLAFPADTSSSAHNQSFFQVITVDDISKFKDIPAGAEVIELVPSMIREIDAGTPQARMQLEYTWGKRVQGDLWISQLSDTYKYDSPKNVKQTVTYGPGDIVTYVQVTVIQSTNQGRAYIIAGGIGQRIFNYVIEANDTRAFYFSSKMFGLWR